MEAGAQSRLTERGFVATFGEAEMHYYSSYGDVMCMKTPTLPTLPTEEEGNSP